MQKYNVYEKIKSTKQCVYFNAENVQTKQPVTIKKLKTNRNWEDILRSREMMFMKQAKYKFIPRILEIIKQNHRFFVVHEQINNNLEQINQKITSKQAIKIASQIITGLQCIFNQKLPLPELKMEHLFFVNQKTMKIGHIHSLIDSQHERTDLKFEEDYRFYPPERLQNGEVNQKSTLFSLGCIISNLLLGNYLIQASSKRQYVAAINQLFPKQKIESILNEQTQPPYIQSFQYRMKNTEAEKDVILLLSDLLRIKPSERISLKEANFRIKHIEQKLNQDLPKDRPKRLSLDKLAFLGSILNKPKSRYSNYKISTQFNETMQAQSPPMARKVSKYVSTETNHIDESTPQRKIEKVQIFTPVFEQRNCCKQMKQANQRYMTMKKLQIKKSKLTNYANKHRSIQSKNSILSQKTYQ